MPISKSVVIFLSIILIIGVLTTITDLRIKKIYNYHLLIGAVLGLSAIIYAVVWAHETIFFHIINGIIGFVIGCILHRFNLWKGGDAKLFTLYAFLMPALKGEYTLISNAINLFACSFIVGTIIITPLFIQDISSNYSTMINNLYAPDNRKCLIISIRITMILSWALFPIYYFTKTIHILAISIIITYFIFYLARRFLINLSPNNIVIGSIIIFGFFVRLWLSPDSLSWPVLFYSIFKLGFFSALSAFIFVSLDLLKEFKNRIPFAPLLFLGCILSYTPLLTRIIIFLRQ